MLLVIDNYDSFTFNLVQYLGELGAEPVVRRNDEITVDQIERLDPDRIVISPGPCTPAEAGISIECVRRLGPRRPLLGVCLGHQSIGSAYGARVIRARRPVHGKVSDVTHGGIDLFAGLPTPLSVARYHSLVIDPSTLPEELEVIGWTSGEHETEEVQAIRHRHHPIWGVQFHPESIASTRGKSLLKNFLSLG